MVAHLDHNEHSVSILITEQGVADLRGLPPTLRARTIINYCADPSYRPLLNDYLDMKIKGQTPQNLNNCFAFHQEFARSGDMRNVYKK
jgi:acyl-CoA hydrolase